MNSKTRKLNKSGGLTIPADMRRHLDLQGGVAVDLEAQNGTMVLRAHAPKCLFCGTHEEVRRHREHHACRPCLEEALKEWGEAHG